MRNRWRRSFVASLSVVALVVLLAFALVVRQVVKTQISGQAVERATETAQITARSAFAPRLPDPGGRLGSADRADLDRQVRSARARDDEVDMRLWSRDGRILYARQDRLIGTRPTRPAVVTPALAGRSSSAVTDDDRLLRTAVPVVRRAGARPAAALELTLPYGPVARDIDRRIRRLDVALAAIALLAYLLVLPGLLRAGRALRSQYDPRRVEVVRELRRAIERGELTLHFQPIVDAQTRRVASVEALVRWDHPRRGRVPPDKFIPVVEPTDAVWPLTLHVLELAMRQARAWRDAGIEVPIAVNVSGEVVPDRRLPGEVRALLERHGLPAGALEIEVTEGAVMRDPAAATKVLGRLTDLGLSVVAIDDFGTGYSSLARLHELPLDMLKIDQSFVKRMAEEGDASVVRSIVDLAHALDLKVIAEGAEDDATVDRLAELGADFVQGYALTRPLPPDDLVRWLARHGERPAPARV